MFLTKLKIALGLASATTLFVAGTAGLVSAQRSNQAAGPRPQAAAPAQSIPPDPPRPAPPEPNTYPLTVSGRALDAAGRPIAGARIFLASTKSDDFRRLAEARTDAAGLYQFRDLPLPTKPPSDPALRFDVGGFEVFGVAEGCGFAWLPAQQVDFLPGSSRREPQASVPGPFRPGEPITLNLTFLPASRLTGTVRDERGQPLARARVRIFNWARTVPDQPFLKRDFRAWSLLPEEILRRSTDDLGSFAFDGLPPNEQFEIEVTPVGSAGRRVAVATSATPPPNDSNGPIRVSPVDLTFATPRDAAVRVTAGDTGRPLPKAFVQVVRLAGEHAWASETTDDDGRVALRLPPGEYRLSILPEYRTPYLILESRCIVPGAGLVPPVDAVLPAAGVLEVTVTDAATGAGVAGASLWEGEPPGPAHPTEDHRQLLSFRSWEVATRTAHVDRPVSDAAGKLRVLIEPGPHRVGIGLNGEPLGWTAVERDGQAIDAQPGQTIPLTFALRKRP